jgi:hypothetical protein
MRSPFISTGSGREWLRRLARRVLDRLSRISWGGSVKKNQVGRDTSAAGLPAAGLRSARGTYVDDDHGDVVRAAAIDS